MLGQIIGTILTLLMLGLALWFGMALLVIVFVVGLGAAIVFWLRGFLVAKDILNPHPGIPLDEEVTIIEGDYEEIERGTEELRN